MSTLVLHKNPNKLYLAKQTCCTICVRRSNQNNDETARFPYCVCLSLNPDPYAMHSLRRQCLILHRLGVAVHPTNSSTTTTPSALVASRRHISCGGVQLARNHYDVLEITPKATQADVKTAYYKMSMIHHPDRNKGNAESVERFRNITAAYEVLSNYRLRRLYDKGVGGLTSEFDGANRHHSADTTEVEEEPEQDDPQTQFYKRHMTRSETPHSSGRTPIYNFDEWAAAHYGKTFARKQHAQTRYRTQQQKEDRASDGLKAEVVVFGILIGFVSLFFIFFQYEPLDRTDPKKK